MSGLGQCENACASLNRCAVGRNLVDQSETLKALNDSNRLAYSFCLDAAVNLPALVADAEDLKANTGTKRVGFFFDEGKYFLIYGECVYTFDDLGLHGFSVFPSAWGYVVKHLTMLVKREGI